jgi:phosphate:Na+ symporter
LLLPMAGALEKLVIRLVPDAHEPEMPSELDERLLAAPPIAMERCMEVAADMARLSVEALKEGMRALYAYSPELAKSIQEKEEQTDHYEDILGTYLVKLSTRPISGEDSEEAAKLLKMIGDFERIGDHAVNLLKSAEEMKRKTLTFTDNALAELKVITAAVSEVLDLALTAFLDNDQEAASRVEPLEQVVDHLKEQLRSRHILRLQQGECTMDVGFVWSDLLTNLERTSDHCSNIAGCIMDTNHHDLNLHETLRDFRNGSEEFRELYRSYSEKYDLRKAGRAHQ